MKAYKEIETDRKKYHNNNAVNTVHRSSLLVPKLQDSQTFISFLNHFLLKRNYTDVVIKISGYSSEGKATDSYTFPVKEPRVYIYNLDQIIKEEVNCFQVEFYSGHNLFIPFPAVMVNHICKQSVNTVHSFNRLLNDPREEDKISSLEIEEASIDVEISNKKETFFIFQSGPLDIINKKLKVSLTNNKDKNRYEEELKLTMPKMSSKKLFIKNIFKIHKLIDIKVGEYTLKINQPKQQMFYGRVLAGIEDIERKSFSGNHSYYDNSRIEEYFNSKVSFRTFPFFKNSTNIVRIYPIMSPGIGKVKLFLNYLDNDQINNKLIKEIEFNNSETYAEFNINNLVRLNLYQEDIKTFTIVYESMNNKGAPTRVNFQLVYGSEHKDNINASINNSLTNEDIFIPKNKSSVTWCQMLNKNNYKSQAGICFFDRDNIPNNKKFEISISIYDESGCISNYSINLGCLDSHIINSSDFNSKSEFIWIMAKTTKPRLSIFTFHTNLVSKISSGEHGF